MNERISTLESRQIELSNIMASSDAHASKCIKLGVFFAEVYPEDYAEYLRARDEYNRNDGELAELRAAYEEEIKNQHIETL